MTEQNKTLNLFYEEPDPDRWFKLDRYPRKLIRRVIRGRQRLGGVQTIAVNLIKGFEKLGIAYRFNNYSYIKKHPEEIACIIGKPHVLFDKHWPNPIILGAGIYSHPIDYPDLLKLHPNVKRILVPGEWMKNMFEPYYGAKVLSWPTGIDTSFWAPDKRVENVDFLIYDKPLWKADQSPDYILNTIIEQLNSAGLTYQYIKYGSYDLAKLLDWSRSSKACIFLSAHETQGLAYQQILSTNTPILAFDKGGYWPDPSYYPHKVQFKPVSSVPYWDDRCGMKFSGEHAFSEQLNLFLNKLDQFAPRDYILENLTLEKCAQKYVDIYKGVEAELKL